MTSADTQQTLDIQIQDDLKYDIRIENSYVESGEFHTDGDPDDILTTDDVDDMSIRHNGGKRHVCSSGDIGSTTGPRGRIDLVDDVSDNRICTLAWSAFMEPGRPNQFMMRNHDPNYEVDIGDFNEFGTMGVVPVSVREL
ncbi:Asp hemolysin-like protein [Aspergillus taichungensis]|uniref:Asp hemolysin-like protein n=1 Tax=Aspergillus taichungensis TaxID=482145 RepID=A0A2J5HXL2_9EURO|nr:Asp hemolysin-like protein [Aspergillus taichungensis]